MSHPQAEADVIFNRTNIALARSQKLIESWLGPDTSASGSTKTEAEMIREDEEMFKAVPETLGVGAQVRDDDLDFGIKRKSNGSNAKLLEQLLGKKAARGHLASKARPTASAGGDKGRSERSTASHTSARQADESDDDDDSEGRAATIKSKRTVKRKRNGQASTATVSTAAEVDQAEVTQTEQSDQDSDQGGGRGRSTGKSTKEKPGNSYLDSVLSKKANKVKKRKTAS